MQLVSKKEVYKKDSIVLTERIFVSNGKKITRVSLSMGKDAVLIIPLDQNNNFYLEKQKRVDNEGYTLEFPNGGIEKGETKLKAAKRELSEELGLEGDMRYIGEFRPFDSLVKLTVSVFVCKNARKQEKVKKLQPDFYEKIKMKRFTQKEIYNLVKQGKIKHSYFLSALTLYNSHA